ncbi:MAG: GNAT family N-acetyltransferase [Pisciglobus halotolerans]|nr:GNAT family N-acetyltransferase [Pisciglobus halotolerans]
MLLEEIIYWSEQSSTIKRLELTVQKRNEKAIHLYEKLGFQLEAVMARGVRDGDRYLDVCLMSKMID